MTPRQLAAYIFLGDRRHERELHERLAFGVLAAHGDGETIKKQLKDLERLL